MQIFKNLEEHIEHIALVFIVTPLSVIAYFLTQALIGSIRPSISKYVLYNRFKKI